MAQIELPNLHLPLSAAPAAGETSAPRAAPRRRGAMIAMGATVAWFALVFAYALDTGGLAEIRGLSAQELAAAIGGAVAPAILFWLILLYLQRGEAFEAHARVLEARLDALAAPDPGGHERVRSIAAGLHQQADIARDATERSLEVLGRATEKLTDATRENEVSLDRRAELLRNTAAEANARAGESARELDERARWPGPRNTSPFITRIWRRASDGAAPWSTPWSARRAIGPAKSAW